MMSDAVKAQLLFWGAALILVLGAVWLLGPVLTPFVVGLIVAYLLNPVVMKLSRLGVPRGFAALTILLLFALFVFTLLALVGPPASREIMALVDNIPRYADILFEKIESYTASLQQYLGPNYLEDWRAGLQSNAGKIATVAGGVAGAVASGGQAVAGGVLSLFLIPLVAFFVMREWPRIVEWTEGLYPRQYESVIKDLLKQIDVKIAGFIRGQLTVALVLGIAYAIALSVAGLNYGFLIGIGAGVLSIIPMLGSLLGFVVAVLVAWFQSGDLMYVAIIGGIFIAGQIIEGNFLTPKLVGDSVGLHPLWVLFAVMAGGALFGILGMLLAVPVAAVIGVLLGFGILQYKKSPLYKGAEEPEPPKKGPPSNG